MRRVLVPCLVAVAALGTLAPQPVPESVQDALERQVRPRAELVALYEPRGFAPLWLGRDGELMAAGRDALRVLEAAADEGLAPADYETGRLHALAGKARAVDRLVRAADPEAVAACDVALSGAMLRYLADLHGGRVDPRSMGFTLDLPRDRHDFAAVLREAADRRQVIDAVRAWAPRSVQYRALAYVLAHYRERAHAERPYPVDLDAPSVRPGQPFVGATALRQRLVFLGDLDASDANGEAVHAGSVVEALKRFQRRHGLEADGVLGRQTRAALAVPLTTRVRQIELAMERLRWVPHDGAGRLVLVNIPMFRLLGWDSHPPSGAPSFTTGTIGGRAVHTQTPVLSATLTDIIFRPYWNVPTSIVRKEILPRLARDPGYLQRERMELVAGQGDLSPVVDTTPANLARLRAGTVRLRQQQGPDNALGLIKFSFPNQHDVYMHGTPAQSLFARSRRDFSHGCVRVEDPVGLATWILGDQGWTRERVEAASLAPHSSRVTVTPPVTVMLLYSTAAVLLDTGQAAFAEDIYRHDTRLDAALRARSVEAGR